MLRNELTPTSRAQLVDEGSVNRVHLEQASRERRITVAWNVGPQARDLQLTALGRTALALDRFGGVRPLAIDADGHIRVTLAPATATTLPGFPNASFIGGEPLLVLEPLTDSYAPFEPTYAKLPEPAQP
jgi:hypothetical protein